MSKFQIPPDYLHIFDISKGFRITEPIDIANDS